MISSEHQASSRSDIEESRSSPMHPRCAVWGIVNVTPDSFSDGGRFLDPETAIEQGCKLLAAGADVLDVGGESSRPAGSTYGEGALPVDAPTELGRVLPVVRALVEQCHARVSIDTIKPEVAAAALSAGASILNDVSCGASDALLRVTAEHGADLVLMHNRARGRVGGAESRYGDLIGEVREELLRATDRARGFGIDPKRIWIDPGFGFAKTAAQSMALLAALPRFTDLGFRVLAGPSRKSFLGVAAPNPDGTTPAPSEREGATVAAVVVAALAGIDAVRVHEVGLARQAVSIAYAVAESRAGLS